MTEEKYIQTLDEVISIINDAVVLMTRKEEIQYKQRIVKDLLEWVKELEAYYNE